jgi:hypothetical protein
MRGFKTYNPFQLQAVLLFSGGIDSLATLRINKLHLPYDHPAAIKAVIMFSWVDSPIVSKEKLLKYAKGRISAAFAVTQDAGVELIPVVTNMWWLDKDSSFCSHNSLGAYLSAISGFFSKRFHKAYIASSFDVKNLEPWGSHPLLDPYYSSAHFQVIHHGLDMTRLEKTRLVAN